MKHTIGYTVTVSLPIRIAYKCSECGYQNVQRKTLTEEGFSNTESLAKENATEKINERINIIKRNDDVNSLKTANMRV